MAAIIGNDETIPELVSQMDNLKKERKRKAKNGREANSHGTPSSRGP